MHTSDFDYHLPASAIAQEPVEPRDAARLLDATGTVPIHRHIRDLPDLVGPGDVLVVNRTRVVPARLGLVKASGGAVEVFLLEEIGPGEWEALVRPGRRVPPGTTLTPRSTRTPPLEVEVGPPMGDEGRRFVRLRADDVGAAIAAHGTVPLPPYINATLADPERYQTVYAETPGSVAAPTAGLHLTPDVLARCRAAGADVVAVDLWVGLGTFKPITAERVEDPRMHAERFEVPAPTIEALRGARRVIAVGTTTVRALESAAATGATAGRTDLYLTPGSRVRVVDVLLTNFHLPRSSLLVLVEAFAGPRWRALYDEALATGYRFLSFGDAMLLARQPVAAGDRWPA